MSPEQESGGEVDARSDIFALGAVLYECLVGEPPPPTPSGAWIASPAPGKMVPRPGSSAQRSRLIPPEWHALLERTMAPLPRDRYQDARALAQALREIGGGMSRAPASTL
jgi:serine/threonine-protein kinase